MTEPTLEGVGDLIVKYGYSLEPADVLDYLKARGFGDIEQARKHKHPELSKSKEGLIEGLAEWLYMREFDGTIGYSWATCKHPDEYRHKAGNILAYLKSHGFGDIEQAKREGAKEEQERIIKYLLDSNVISADGEYFKALKQEGK